MNETLNSSAEKNFFDPFAEAGQENFDPVVAHANLWERYKNHEIEHDYTADNFLSDTQALMMDAQFLGQFAQAQVIVARMHELCGEDHGLAQSLQNNEVVSNYLNSFDSHSGHNHKPGQHNKNSDKDDEKEKDPKKDKKTNKKSKPKRGWFGVYR